MNACRTNSTAKTDVFFGVTEGDTGPRSCEQIRRDRERSGVKQNFRAIHFALRVLAVPRTSRSITNTHVQHAKRRLLIGRPLAPSGARPMKIRSISMQTALALAFFVHSAPAFSQVLGETLPAEIRVQLQLENTELTPAEVVNALEEEFGVVITVTEEPAPLLLQVNSRTLTASFENESGETVSRELNLPEAPSQQADAVALLAGNIARDEAAILLAQLTAAQEKKAEEKRRLAETAEKLKEEEELILEKEQEQAVEERRLEADSERRKREAEAEEKEKAEKLAQRPPIPIVPYSFTFSGDIGTPEKLSQKQTQFGLGAVYTDVGSVDGFAASILLLRNRGRAQNGAGRGAQLSLIWLGREGEFEGFSGSLIAATERGGTQGVQAGGLVALQDGDVEGAQLSLGAAVANGKIQGGQAGLVMASAPGDLQGIQLSLVASLMGGNVEGIQGSAIAASTRGNIQGGQLGGISAYTQEKVDGFQIGFSTVAREIDGFQFGGVNVARHSVDGAQIGVVNYGGGEADTQVGLINIGGRVRGSQIGLLNVAQDVDGVAIAPFNIVPGLRTQLVTYASYTHLQESRVGTPDPMMFHVGAKVLSGSFYSEFSFGLGPEGEECSGPTGDPLECTGGGVAYAPGVAFGGRFQLSESFFLEGDLQYEFQKAFSPSDLHQHALAPRFSAGFQVSEHVASYIGGGPRFAFRDGTEISNGPEFNVFPYVYGGLRFF
jgi:hypothetical protein